MLKKLKLQNTRCFSYIEAEFAPGHNYLVGPNSQGKSTLLEAVCILLRLQSPRTKSLKHVIAHGKSGFAVQGSFASRLLQFYFGHKKKKLALDTVEQSSAAEYLNLGNIVFLANSDIELITGSAEKRRVFLDFLAMQVFPGYRKELRNYTRALRHRNALLKEPKLNWQQIDSYTPILAGAGDVLLENRKCLVQGLAPETRRIQRQISNGQEPLLELSYQSSAEGSLREALLHSRSEEVRLRQTLVGPHRDDLLLSFEGSALANFSSEGQQRTAALSLKLAQREILRAYSKNDPILLLDDVFGELDTDRRNALLQELPRDSQVFIAATSLAWMESGQSGALFQVGNGTITSN